MNSPQFAAFLPIRLIVGLGNPGDEYAHTRHNAGFWLIDQLAQQSGASLRSETRFQGQCVRAQINGNEVWLLKPQTFMNRSGQSIAALARFYKIEAAQILVVHDELDLLPGDVKLKHAGGAAGHNGLKDTTAQLGTPNYWRLRVGIGHPRDYGAADPRAEVLHFVLKAPRREDQALIDNAIERSLEIVPQLVKGEFEAAMKTLHGARPARA